MRTALKLTCTLACIVAVTGCRSGGTGYVSIDRHPAERTIARQQLRLPPFRSGAAPAAKSQLAASEQVEPVQPIVASTDVPAEQPAAAPVQQKVAQQPLREVFLTSWPPLPSPEAEACAPADAELIAAAPALTEPAITEPAAAESTAAESTVDEPGETFVVELAPLDGDAPNTEQADVASESSTPIATCITLDEWLANGAPSAITQCTHVAEEPFDNIHVEQLKSVQTEIRNDRIPEFAVPLLDSPAAFHW